MEHTEKQGKTSHISEETNINSGECEVNGGKPGEFTVLRMFGGILDQLISYDSTLCMAKITIEVTQEQKEKVFTDLERETDGLFCREMYENKPMPYSGSYFIFTCH